MRCFYLIQVANGRPRRLSCVNVREKGKQWLLIGINNHAQG
jgi:hypothetical protein